MAIIYCVQVSGRSSNEERGFAVHMPYILRIGPDTLVPSDGKV